MDDKEIDIEVSEKDYQLLKSGADAEGLTVEEFLLKIVEKLIDEHEKDS